MKLLFFRYLVIVILCLAAIATADIDCSVFQECSNCNSQFECAWCNGGCSSYTMCGTAANAVSSDCSGICARFATCNAALEVIAQNYTYEALLQTVSPWESASCVNQSVLFWNAQCSPARFCSQFTDCFSCQAGGSLLDTMSAACEWSDYTHGCAAVGSSIALSPCVLPSVTCPYCFRQAATLQSATEQTLNITFPLWTPAVQFTSVWSNHSRACNIYTNTSALPLESISSSLGGAGNSDNAAVVTQFSSCWEDAASNVSPIKSAFAQFQIPPAADTIDFGMLTTVLIVSLVMLVYVFSCIVVMPCACCRGCQRPLKHILGRMDYQRGVKDELVFDNASLLLLLANSRHGLGADDGGKTEPDADTATTALMSDAPTGQTKIRMHEERSALGGLAFVVIVVGVLIYGVISFVTFYRSPMLPNETILQRQVIDTLPGMNDVYGTVFLLMYNTTCAALQTTAPASSVMFCNVGNATSDPRGPQCLFVLRSAFVSGTVTTVNITRTGTQSPMPSDYLIHATAFLDRFANGLVERLSSSTVVGQDAYLPPNWPLTCSAATPVGLQMASTLVDPLNMYAFNESSVACSSASCANGSFASAQGQQMIFDIVAEQRALFSNMEFISPVAQAPLRGLTFAQSIAQSRLASDQSTVTIRVTTSKYITVMWGFGRQTISWLLSYLSTAGSAVGLYTILRTVLTRVLNDNQARMAFIVAFFCPPAALVVGVMYLVHPKSVAVNFQNARLIVRAMMKGAFSAMSLYNVLLIIGVFFWQTYASTAVSDGQVVSVIGISVLMKFIASGNVARFVAPLSRQRLNVIFTRADYVDNLSRKAKLMHCGLGFLKELCLPYIYTSYVGLRTETTAALEADVRGATMCSFFLQTALLAVTFVLINGTFAAVNLVGGSEFYSLIYYWQSSFAVIIVLTTLITMLPFYRQLAADASPRWRKAWRALYIFMIVSSILGLLLSYAFVSIGGWAMAGPFFSYSSPLTPSLSILPRVIYFSLGTVTQAIVATAFTLIPSQAVTAWSIWRVLLGFLAPMLSLAALTILGTFMSSPAREMLIFGAFLIVVLLCVFPRRVDARAGFMFASALVTALALLPQMLMGQTRMPVPPSRLAAMCVLPVLLVSLIFAVLWLIDEVQPLVDNRDGLMVGGASVKQKGEAVVAVVPMQTLSNRLLDDDTL